MVAEVELPKLVVVGAGGHGREVADVVAAINEVSPRFRFVGFVDDGHPHLDRLNARGAVLLDGFDDARAEGASYLVGVGDPHLRRALSDRAEARGLEAASAVHPSARLGSVNALGPGFVACAMASVTTNVTVGRHVHLNVHGAVAHDCVLGDYVTVNPGAHVSGEVRLGDGVTVGSGAVVIQGVTVGAGTMIGAGAVVTRDLPEAVVAVGAPARPTRSIA